MKTIMYISKSTEISNMGGLPSSMASIVIGGRKSNRSNKLRSLMCYTSGSYMHAIEGDNEVVDGLFKSISKDRRHKDITVLVESEAQDFILDDNPLKLAIISEYDDAFCRYVGTYLSKKYLKKISVGAVFKDLQRDIESPAAHKGGFSGCTIALMDWPDFTVIEPARELLELCAMLMNSAISYSALSENNPYANASSLDVSLEKLRTLGLLELGEAKRDVSLVVMPNLFFKKMRTFIRGVAA